MSLIEIFVRNPVKIAVGVLLVALFGVVAIFRMPMQLTPEVQVPTITIETRWPGASPGEVEKEIITEQEEQLNGVEGVTKMTSSSADSLATIIMEFRVGVDMEESLLKVNSRLQQVREYPEDADQPVITTANASDRPIAWFILSSLQPDDAKLADFESRYPALVEDIATIRASANTEVAMSRLRTLAETEPAFLELLPPPGFDVTKFKRFAEDEIESRFERVSGVSQSNVIGGLEDALLVVIDPERLAARQLTLPDVRQVLRSQNEDTSAGDFWEGKRRWVVRAMGQFRTPEQVENQLLAVHDGAPVFVRDVADVRLGYKKPDGVVRRFGESAIAINCVRERGANVLDVMDGLRETTARLNKEILHREGLQLTQVYDETDYINSSVDLVQQNILIGGALTMVVLMVFLHLGPKSLIAVPFIIATAIASAFVSTWFFVLCLAIVIGAGFWFARGALVVGLAIPVSIIGTFLVLGMLGRSLNVISLAGLAFAVGMLVDNAVVVLENIYRRHQLGDSPLNAAVKGTQEVLGAVVASTVTTIAVFLPIVFVQEEAGQLFRDIALAVSAAVALSLVVSMTVIPTAAARLFSSEDPRKGSETQSSGGERAGALADFLNRLGARFVAMVVSINRWIQQSTPRRLVTVVLLVAGAAFLSWILWPKVEYLPSGNRNLVFGIVIPPPGYNLDQLMELGESVEAGLRPYIDVDLAKDDADDLDYPVVDDFFFVARGRQVFMGIRSKDATRAGELVPLVQKLGGKLPGAFAVAKQSSLFEQGLSAGRTVEVEITGPDLARLVALGGRILGGVREILPTAQVRPIPSLDMSTPEIHVEPKLLQAAEMGISSADLGFTVNALVDGAYGGDFYLGGKKIDIVIKGEDRFSGRTQAIDGLPIATPTGQLVPLAALADSRITSGPEQVNHRERSRAITIEVSPPPEVALEDAMERIDRELIQPIVASGELDGGYQISLAGTADKLRETWGALQSNFLLAVIITYLLIAGLFESWLYPLVIIAAVPVGAVGGVLGLALLNLFMLQSLDVLTMLGFVILIGTVVNNPILVVHQSLNHMRYDGMSPRDAILESVRNRIRPIFMTTSTTVLGLAPLVLFPGAGSELYRGLGSVVLGGLIVSTVVTLVLVPTLFSLLMDSKAFFVGRTRSDAPSTPGSSIAPTWDDAPTRRVPTNIGVAPTANPSPSGVR